MEVYVYDRYFIVYWNKLQKKSNKTFAIEPTTQIANIHKWQGIITVYRQDKTRIWDIYLKETAYLIVTLNHDTNLKNCKFSLLLLCKKIIKIDISRCHKIANLKFKQNETKLYFIL